MNFTPPFTDQSSLLNAIAESRYAEENRYVRGLLEHWAPSLDYKRAIAAVARDLVEHIRDDENKHGGLDAFLQEFELSSQEGVLLMCLAEALLRVPDKITVDKLIRDKIGDADWASHLGHSSSLFVNASTWALMLTGKIVKPDLRDQQNLGAFMKRLVARNGEPIIRTAITRAMRIMGQQFVLSEDIAAALKAAKKKQALGYRYSYDMLGEAARTDADAIRYYDEYVAAIEAIGEAAIFDSPIRNPGISVKLSALHARYEFSKVDRIGGELYARLHSLVVMAKSFNINLTIDAEESDRLEISLAILERLALDPQLAGWQGLGLAVQAYQKQAPAVIDWLIDLAERSQHKFMVRLVKGAYWDTEIKRAQEMGLREYPVFTRKASTDLCYLVCAKKMLAHRDAIYSQFATHNAFSVAAITQLADGDDFEFQCLHGMGETLYRQIVENSEHKIPCRIYAPVGPHKDLLAYLVRRLLENGANSSFVNRLSDIKLPIEDIIADPTEALRELNSFRHNNIPLPADLYAASRKNSKGADITEVQLLAELQGAFESRAGHLLSCGSILATKVESQRNPANVVNPANSGDVVGTVVSASSDDVEQALQSAAAFSKQWDDTGAEVRASLLEHTADLMESSHDRLIEVCVREAGKTLLDAIAEIREAVDFLRYYAMRARLEFADPEALPGPTGESNTLSLHGRGVFVCISPWNFPLAIFCGQVGAALAAGNCVIAKPAEQTPLIAGIAVGMFHNAGVPRAALQLLPGDGAQVGAKLVADERIAGVAFTGSTETAKRIQQSLAARNGPIVPFIAETGGQNTMLVDSTALPEQVVRDVITSAFQSAGQRCSALRVLYLQREIADTVIAMLRGAMAELETGDPINLATDIGPIIDAQARQKLEEHLEKMTRRGYEIFRAPDAKTNSGHFFSPALLEIETIGNLEREVFGPVLHVVRYSAESLDTVLDEINATGYGLTLGIHSRIDETVEYICNRVHAGNIYVNRNIIGAIVGSQPFGGEGLSGSGPKAGGPRYLHRFATERTISTDTTAAGGNASLMSMD